MTKLSFQKCTHIYLHLFREIWHLDIYLSYFFWRCLSLVVLVLSLCILLWFSKFCKVFFLLWLSAPECHSTSYILKLKKFSASSQIFRLLILLTILGNYLHFSLFANMQRKNWIICEECYQIIFDKNAQFLRKIQ